MSGTAYGTEAASLIEVGENVFAYVQPDGTWWVNNCGLVTGNSGALVVDSCATEKRTRAFLAAIASVTSNPVRTVVNTHHHSDHTFGNYLFGGATVVAHQRTREEALRTGGPGPNPFWNDFDFGHIELAPPTLTFSDSVTLWVDDLACQVLHVGTPAHTTNDSIIWLPARGVLFSGDLLFNDGTPFNAGGSISGAIAVLTEVLAPLRPTVIVPGHGPVGDAALIDRVVGYLCWVQELAAAGLQAGLTPLEVALETDLGPYSAWSDPERLVGNLHRAYAELGGTPPGTRIDVRAAMTDMVTYNGGHRLTCRA